ncbi:MULTISPECIES: AAA family ATPase [unclassified Arcicella]|uniref:AAA family ATPase n=1 Tax=unclassified Arcicella TaxID=2644986 RepID=UPI0028621B35|nr:MULTISPECIES: AAA family ATPase [unclassified Arcicella]MDR6561357.1 exonuclease SbcC [Arcicella sp. BE51]MDR6811241.1 exonuclease SbcC [Arcicella sp. BE140]MDR6822591.1 exonuclease SbcC [Arcicella sp. BE139]
MKINKIYLKNINSFKGEHSIDFTASPLSTAGLFAIVGPTGAGKSTLLDAITLALFNRVPRFDKKISKDLVGSGGSILTRGEKECVVEVEYVCKSGVYVSKWWINVNRNNNLNDYGMELIDKVKDQIITNKKTDVPDKNQSLIGLNYDQFVKSILLSQGEFSKFLKSGKDERGKLLEDITGMQIYRLLGKKAFEINNEKGGELKLKRNQIKSVSDKLVAKEIAENWEKDLLEKELLISQANENIEKTSESIRVKNALAIINQEIFQKEKDFVTTKAIWQQFETEKLPILQQHQLVEPFREQIAQVKNDERELVNLQNRQETQTKDLLNNQEAFKRNLEAIATLTKQEVGAENAREVLLEYRRKVTELMRELSEQEGTLKAKQQQINESISFLRIPQLSSLSVNQLADNSLVLIQSVAQAQKVQMEKWYEIAEISSPEEIEEKGYRLEFEVKLYHQLNQLISEYSNLKTLFNEAEKEEKIQLESQNSNTLVLEKKQTLLATLIKKIEQLESEKERLGKSYNFEKDRATLLKKDEACPLCGSLEHPFLSHYANNYVEIDQDLKAQKIAEKELSNEVNILTTQIASARQIEIKEQQKKQGFQDKLTEKHVEITDIKQNLQLDKVGNRAWVQDQIKLKEGQTEALNLLIKSSKVLEDLRVLHKIVKETKGFQEQKNTLLDTIKGLYAGKNINNDCDILQQQFSELQTKITANQHIIQQLRTEIKEKSEAVKEVQNELLKALQSLGFTDVEEAQKQLLSVEQSKSLRDEQEKLRTRITVLENELKSKKIEFELKQQEDNPRISLEELIEFSKTLQEQRKAVADEVVDLRVKIQSQNTLFNEVSVLTQEIAFLEKSNLKWELLNRYIGDAEGKKFSTFAQGLTLARLVALSNRRLAELSDRYLLDKPTENEDDELMIVDQYMGNERRSVKTLSGGETFMVSLSLALALSDLASKNVKLESLFIDEGFGTLDPETLDLALSTLEKLQQEGQKNIGIISHVESIKERISTQIKLERNNRGFSKIEIKS